MNNPRGHGYNPQLGATFYPGGHDDFYMPEVISPAPQRIMPEVPENMQDNLAQLEQQAQGQRPPGPQSPGQYDPRYSAHPNGQPPMLQYHDTRGYGASYGDYGPPQTNQQPQPNVGNGAHEGYQHPPAAYQDQGPDLNPGYHDQARAPDPYGPPDRTDQPSFSPFPLLRNPPSNVPPTNAQRESNLETGRQVVLGSGDAQYQLDWAQDALSYVEVAQANEGRLALFSAPRPQTPRVEHQLRVDAINIVEFLANQDHPKAMFLMGTWYEFGKFGFREDPKEAFRCYSRAAENGYARAEYRIGMQFESSNEPQKAIGHYEKGVAANDSASNYRLGMMILLGQCGQHQDYRVGLKHIREAALTADENAPQGAYVYGMLMARDLPQVKIPDSYVPLDTDLARVNIEKAAFLGFAKAQVKMGSAYELCQLGCDFNPALSLHYNALAARQGEPDAEMAISKWFLCGHDGVFEKNEQLAFEYAERAAYNGLPTAEFAMGYFYEIGIHVQPDLKAARHWYQRAAAQGNKDAAGRIEGISRAKTLSRKDHESTALAKIKSQRGHQGPQSNVPPMPPMPLEMPDISNLRIQTNPYGDPQRPPSAAPYPSQDAMLAGRPRPGDPSGYFGPDIRPGSAFGINPNLRPSSARPDNYRMPPGPQRPYSRANDGGYGPGVQSPQQRIPPGPGGPLDHRPPGRGYPPSAGPQAPPQKYADIGFSAPPDLSGADRRRRPPRGDNPSLGNMGKPQPPLPQQRTPSIPPDRVSSRPSAGPNSYGPATYSNPGRMNSLPSKQTVRPGQETRPPPGAAPRPSGRPHGGAGSGQAATRPTQAKPPAKGPKTFEEMGVPQGKGDGDCVVM